MQDATIYSDQADAGTPPDAGAEWCPSLYWTAPTPFDPGAPVAGTELAAFINEGRWIVGCPDCNGAQLAALDDPRFMCVDCGNAGNSGAWRPVTFPPALPAIVAALEVRVDVTDQSWTPGTTVDDLVAENITLGVGDTPPVDPVPVDPNVEDSP